MTTETQKPKRRRLPPMTAEEKAAKLAAKKAAQNGDSPPKVEKSQEAIANGEAAPKAGKKAVAPGKQKRIEGSFEKAPPEVVELANEYANALHDRQAIQNTENSLRDKLKEVMKSHGIVEIETDDSYVTFVHEEKDKIKVKMKTDEDG